MQLAIAYATLAVADFASELRFYRDGLGLTLQKLGSDPDHPYAFFRCGALTLALYPRALLSAASGFALQPGQPGRTVLSLNLGSRQHVDACLAAARAAGAEIAKPASVPPWGGYCGFFSDPEGFVWEVTWQPEFDFVATYGI